MKLATTDLVPIEDEITEEELSLLREAGEKFLRPEQINDEEDSRLDAEAQADIAAGRFVTNDAVMTWLESLGSDRPLPRPTWRK